MNNVGNASLQNYKTNNDNKNKNSINNMPNIVKKESNDNITNFRNNPFFRIGNNFNDYFLIEYLDETLISNQDDKSKSYFFKKTMSVLEIFENYFSTRKQYLNDEENSQIYEYLNKIIKANFKDRLSQNNSQISNTSNYFIK
jgi:hypothetical protein